MNGDRPMNIDRPMANLFFQIKRSMPFELRDQMKISAPDVGEKLISMYRSSDDEALKSMIKDFMTRAGGDWKAQVDSGLRSRLVQAIVQKVSH